MSSSLSAPAYMSTTEENRLGTRLGSYRVKCESLHGLVDAVTVIVALLNLEDFLFSSQIKE